MVETIHAGRPPGLPTFPAPPLSKRSDGAVRRETAESRDPVPDAARSPFECGISAERGPGRRLRIQLQNGKG